MNPEETNDPIESHNLAIAPIPNEFKRRFNV
jgi:hypothetical protein